MVLLETFTTGFVFVRQSKQGATTKLQTLSVTQVELVPSLISQTCLTLGEYLHLHSHKSENL